MKNPVFLLVICSLLVFFLELSLNFENALAQEPRIVCEATLKAWRMDPSLGPEFADQYYCPHRYGYPVFRPSPGPWIPTLEIPTIDWPALEEQRNKETWAREEMLRKRMLMTRQKELEREKELFELGKSKLLNTLKEVGPSQPPGLKRAGGHPIVAREALGSIEYSDLKSILAEMSDEDLKLLARWASDREEKLVASIKRTEEKELRATLRAGTIPNFKTWEELLWEKIKDIAPLWRLMEQLGKKAAGDFPGITTDDIYKGIEGGKKLYDVIQGMLPTPDQLAEQGKKIAKMGTVVLKIVPEVVDVSWRLGDMYIFNEILRDEQKAGQVLALEFTVIRNDLERKLNETREVQKRVEEELKHR